MAYWLPGQKLYLPPPPVAQVVCTEDYVTRKDIYYHGETERLLFVGHPFFNVNKGGEGEIKKVSGNQYRVFEIQLPDPNKFALPDKDAHNPSKERLVWGVVGITVSRGQPLNGAVTGHSAFNFMADGENLNKKTSGGPATDDDRKQVGMDVKQVQMLLLGCQPATGEYWGIKKCAEKEVKKGDCPPIQLLNKPIEDGDMIEMGFGNCDFKEFNPTKSEIPLDLVDEKSVYPDFLQMAEEASGNKCFFYARREQSYLRHIYSVAGQELESIPVDLFKTGSKGSQKGFTFRGTASGSLLTTDGQLFNRPYWLLRAQGQNNGICWRNKLYVTVADNTRGGSFLITVESDSSTGQYNAQKFNLFTRHAEEYKLACIFQLCAVELTPTNIAHIQTANPGVLEDWEIAMQAPSSSVLHDIYTYPNAANSCKTPEAQAAKKDEKKYNFYEIDFTERLSLDLSQFPLGRKFLAQIGRACSIPTFSRKRKAAAPQVQKRLKRRKTAK